MAEFKKVLDQIGLQYLWSKISMEDYPNNETLIAVINAIDETKANNIPVTTEDNGKFMRVVDGAWAAASIPNAEEASF